MGIYTVRVDLLQFLISLEEKVVDMEYGVFWLLRGQSRIKPRFYPRLMGVEPGAYG